MLVLGPIHLCEFLRLHTYRYTHTSSKSHHNLKINETTARRGQRWGGCLGDPRAKRREATLDHTVWGQARVLGVHRQLRDMKPYS